MVSALALAFDARGPGFDQIGGKNRCPNRVRRFTEITEIPTEITEIPTEITVELTKVCFNGVHYTTIYYCKLYFSL